MVAGDPLQHRLSRLAFLQDQRAEAALSGVPENLEGSLPQQVEPERLGPRREDREVRGHLGPRRVPVDGKSQASLRVEKPDQRRPVRSCRSVRRPGDGRRLEDPAKVGFWELQEFPKGELVHFQQLIPRGKHLADSFDRRFSESAAIESIRFFDVVIAVPAVVGKPLISVGIRIVVIAIAIVIGFNV